MGKLLAPLDAIHEVRSADTPFAVPKPQRRVTEADIVKDVLQVLQGLSGQKIAWNKRAKRFELQDGTHVSHLSHQSLHFMLMPFLTAAACSRRVGKFISKALRSTNAKALVPKCPTLEAFANAVAMRLKSLRNTVMEKELAALRDLNSAPVTLLNLSANLSGVCAVAEFLDHVVRSAVPQNYTTYDPSMLSLHILASLFNSLDRFCLLKDGEEQAYRTLLVLFVGSVWPCIQSLDRWLQEGSLPHGEQPFCPSFLEQLAKPILSSGKSLQLLQQVQRESGKVVPNASPAPVSIFDEFCLSLKKLLSRDDSIIHQQDADTNGAPPWRDAFVSSQLPPLEDTELRQAVFSDTKDGAVTAKKTDFVHGNGCGQILQLQMTTDRKATKRIISCLTYVPTLLDTGVLTDSLPHHKQNKGVTTTLEWLERTNFSVAISSRIIVQQCLVPYIESQVNGIGAQLLKKLMSEWHLMEELALLRAVYLMGSGDLLQQFSFVLFNKLDRGEPCDDFYELNTMLQESLRSSADAASYSTLDTLVLKMEAEGRGSSLHPLQFSGRNPIHGIDILDSLFFEYKVAWPLELIIDLEAIKRYNQVMCFLLKVKRAKQALDKACRWMWKGDSGSQKPQLLLQMKLMHFVNTLHHYVMDQVLYSSWTEFCEGMASAKSLDEVTACHDAYLTSIQRQCFVAPDKLWTLISSRVKTILGLALDFYSIQRALMGAGSGPAAPPLVSRCQLELGNVAKQFDECIAFLLRVLSFKLNVGHFPHLTDLITRINYNNYYISETGQLLAPIPGLHHQQQQPQQQQQQPQQQQQQSRQQQRASRS